MHNGGTEETGLYLEFGSKQLMTQKTCLYLDIRSIFFCFLWITWASYQQYCSTGIFRLVLKQKHWQLLSFSFSHFNSRVLSFFPSSCLSLILFLSHPKSFFLSASLPLSPLWEVKLRNSSECSATSPTTCTYSLLFGPETVVGTGTGS